MYPPAAPVHLLEGEGGGGREGERGGGEDEASGRGRDVTTGVHGVKVLEAGEVEKETEEVGKRLVDYPEGGEEQCEQALGVGGEPRGELQEEEVQGGMEGVKEGGDGGAGGGEEGPEEETEEPAAPIESDFDRV